MQGIFMIEPRYFTLHDCEYVVIGYTETAKGVRRAVAQVKTPFGFVRVTDIKTRKTLMNKLEKYKKDIKHI